MIEGVRLTPLRQIVDERGKIMHMMKSTDPNFKQFGEIYFSCAWPGVVKGWHVHNSMTLNMAVISGHAKFACYDTRLDSSSLGGLVEFCLGEDVYGLLTIPPGVWSGYAPYGDELTIVANCATEPHEPSEIRYARYDKLPGTEVAFEWLVTHG